MLEKSDGYEKLLDTSLADYFRNGGETLSEESAILGIAIRRIVAAGKRITHKALILELIEMIETSDDAQGNDIIRNTLEIVVHHTADDL